MKRVGILAAVLLTSASAFAQRLYEIRPTPGINGGYDVYAPRGLGAPRQGGNLQIPSNLVTPAAPLDYSGVINAYDVGYQNASRRINEREAAENMRQNRRLLKQRERIEAEQYRANLELQRQEREAALAEIKLRKATAEAKLAELKAKAAEEKARKDADPIRRQEAQLRFDKIAAQVQREAEEAKARKKTLSPSREQLPENEKKGAGSNR